VTEQERLAALAERKRIALEEAQRNVSRAFRFGRVDTNELPPGYVLVEEAAEDK
jgi:hypothetical protein